MKTNLKANLQANLTRLDDMTAGIRRVKASVGRILRSKSLQKMVDEYLRLMRLPGWQGRCLPHCYALTLMEKCDSLKVANDICSMIRKYPPNCHEVMHKWLVMAEMGMIERFGSADNYDPPSMSMSIKIKFPKRIRRQVQ